jgi:site-specific DNA-methyltransferase (adenine-specific)
MKKLVIGNATLYLGTMEETIGGIEHVDHILTDPPYLYIKTHDFDRPWNEPLFFENAKRLLPDDGFIAMSGRGTSFYRWNTRLADLGFIFKEEIVWDKRYTTAPCIALSRVHETFSLHTKKTGKILRSKVPYVEQKQFDIESIVNDIKRIKSAINTEAGLNRVLVFLQSGEKLYEHNMTIKHHVSQQPIKIPDRAVCTVEIIKEGMKEKSMIHSTGGYGMRERSIVELKNNHYKLSHPTEKPVRLAEHILVLISERGDTIYDPFMGSGSFGVACIRTGRKYIGSEMKPEYFEIACKRIQQALLENCLWQA